METRAHLLAVLTGLILAQTSPALAGGQAGQPSAAPPSHATQEPQKKAPAHSELLELIRNSPEPTPPPPRGEPVCAKPCRTLAKDQGFAVSLAVHDGHVYWTSIYDKRVLRVPITGGKVEPLIEDNVEHDLVVDRSGVYWLAAAGLRRQARPEHSPVNIAPGLKNARFLQYDGAFFYWMERGTPERHNRGCTLKRVSREGGEVQVVAIEADERAEGLAVDDRFVYWTTDRGRVVRAPRAGGEREVLYQGIQDPGWLIVAGDQLYWPMRDGQIMRAPRVRTPGIKPVVIASGAGVVEKMAIAGDLLVWTDSKLRKVMAVPSRGGEVRSLADEPGIPAGLAVEGKSIYWVVAGSPERQFADGEIRTMKP